MSFSLPPKHTKRFVNFSLDDVFDNETVIVAGGSSEVRGQIPQWSELKKKNPNRLIYLSQKDEEQISVDIGNNSNQVIGLRDDDALRKLISAERLLIDVSGLPHNIWAPLLKVAHDTGTQTRVLYAEPESYKSHPTPASSTLFDLSVSFGGLSPLPGFARLSGPDDEKKCLFVAALGFEGNRPERMVLQVDPEPKVIPIVGVPGFQLEFPAFTIACNRNFLHDFKAYSELRFARASCPFEIYKILQDLNRDFSDHHMYLAPVGTKPHSLGLVLFAIKNPRNTEIVFDYPIKQPDRTKGIGLIHIYDFGNFDAL